MKVDYLIPREGALMWFDSFAMPADAELDQARVTIAEARKTIGWAQAEEEEARKRAEQLRAEVKQLEAQRANTAKNRLSGSGPVIALVRPEAIFLLREYS